MGNGRGKIERLINKKPLNSIKQEEKPKNETQTPSSGKYNEEEL